jgi:hypothetical protein
MGSHRSMAVRSYPNILLPNPHHCIHESDDFADFSTLAKICNFIGRDFDILDNHHSAYPDKLKETISLLFQNFNQVINHYIKYTG